MTSSERLLRPELKRLHDEVKEIQDLIRAYTGNAAERTTLMRVSRHIALHQVSAKNLLTWLDYLGTDIVAPSEIRRVQDNLQQTSEEIDRLLEDSVP
ncbi:MAG: hypothetical protein AAGD43_17140 [Pseudomonadota bacterium]